MWDHFEKYRTSKVELETLTQELQKELEKLKATCLINTEKIGYNYQVRITSINISIYGQKLFIVCFLNVKDESNRLLSLAYGDKGVNTVALNVERDSTYVY